MMTTSDEFFKAGGELYRQEQEAMRAKLLKDFPALAQIEADLKPACDQWETEMKANGNHPCNVDGDLQKRLGQLFIDARDSGAFPNKKVFNEFTRGFMPARFRDQYTHQCMQLVAPPTAGDNSPLANLADRIIGLCFQEMEIGAAEREPMEERHEKEVAELEKRQAEEANELAARLEPQHLPLRIERGKLLIEARKLVKARSWEKWCRDNFRDGIGTSRSPNGQAWIYMSQSDIRACIALAEAEDPVAAHEEEKAKTAERVRKHRAAKKESAVTSAPVTAVPTVSRDEWTAAAKSQPLAHEPTTLDQLANCSEWRSLTNPITEESLSPEYHAAIAALSAVTDKLEYRLIERWINAHWNAGQVTVPALAELAQADAAE